MASITIHHLDDTTKARLTARAQQNGRSVQAEAREILVQAMAVEKAAAPEVQAPSEEIAATND